MSAKPERRSECPISSALDILGDKWTLLVMRDVLEGNRRFSEFERSPERIPTNILSDRLRRLVATGLLTRTSEPGSKRVDYRPTEAGRALRSVLLGLAEWGNSHLDDTWVPPDDYLTGG